MATVDDQEMTCAGGGLPRDEDMRAKEAEPSLQKQMELDMDLLKADINLPTSLISMLSRLVDTNKALNEQNAGLMAEVDTERK